MLLPPSPWQFAQNEATSRPVLTMLTLSFGSSATSFGLARERNSRMDLASQRIRDKLRYGILPSCEPVMSWAGYGNGTLCDGCDMAIQPKEVEYEVDLENGQTLHLHVACVGLWQVLRGN